MKDKIILEICSIMTPHLSPEQNKVLNFTVEQVFSNYLILDEEETCAHNIENNQHLIELFIAAKKIEGCSPNTLKYYSNTLTAMIHEIQKDI